MTLPEKEKQNERERERFVECTADRDEIDWDPDYPLFSAAQNDNTHLPVGNLRSKESDLLVVEIMDA